jgi:hypothetical protein
MKNRTGSTPSKALGPSNTSIQQLVEVPKGGIVFRRYWQDDEIRRMGEDCISTQTQCAHTLDSLRPELAFLRSVVRTQQAEGKPLDGMTLRSVAEANHLEIAKAADQRDWTRFAEGFRLKGFFRTVKHALYDFVQRKKPLLTIGSLQVYHSKVKKR